MVLGLFTELTTSGGVQRVGRHIAAILASFAKDRGLPCRLLSLNDPAGSHDLVVGDLAFKVQGFGRRKTGFVLAALSAAPRVQVAYCAHPNLAPLGLLMKLVQPACRYLVTAHGTDAWERIPLLRRYGLRWAHTVTTPSQFTGQKMASVNAVDPRKVTVLPWALDPGMKKPNGTGSCFGPILPPGRVLLTVARLDASERYKGVDTVIAALPNILNVIPGVHYIVIGDGDDRPRLENLARETGVADHVLFAGQVGDELAAYYDLCDVFVMPSRGEGFGLVFLEAMAFGKPTIGCNDGGIPEVVTDKLTGFLVAFGDVKALADRLLLLLQDVELRRQMGEAGRRRVKDNFTFEHFRSRFVQLLL